MAISAKFGSTPVAPLYNATGRNPRDMDMGNPGKGLGNVGNSGAGGKDFGTPGKQAQAADLSSSIFSPFNPYNIMMNPGGIGRNRQSAVKRGRGGGGGGGRGGRIRGFFGGRGGRGGEADDSGDPEGTVYDESGRRVAVDAMERTKQDLDISLGDQTGGDQTGFGSRSRLDKNATAVVGDYAKRDVTKGNQLTSTVRTTPATPGTTPATGKGSRGPRTAEQREATAAKRAANKAANPAYGRRGTTPRPAPAAAAPTTYTAEQSIGNLKQKIMGNL